MLSSLAFVLLLFSFVLIILAGSTPLCTKISEIYRNKQQLIRQSGKQLLIVVITDGEPSDGSHDDLRREIVNVTANGDCHVSFAECTDEESDMDYLDRWDGQIRNFDNTEDFRDEQRRVRQVNGPNFKFDYSDYVVKILLATFVRWYFNLDQGAVNNSNYNRNW